jgi:ABC-type dipeptide/oligopeptide/nickel transport system permease subunit
MKLLRIASWVVVVLAIAAILSADLLAPAGYAEQFRDYPSAAPSSRFPLGTDELGRDRLSRLMHGTRVSLLLAPAAAAIATVLALITGIAAAWHTRIIEPAILGFTDVLASIPTLFLLLSARAALPLDIAPVTSVCLTFALLGFLGWTNASRVVRAAVVNVRKSSWILQARATGVSPLRILLRQVVPSLLPVASAVFWTSIPIFLIAEANLGLLGLGVTEPLPSLGSLLAELQNFYNLTSAPWRLAPAVVLVTIITAVQVVVGSAKEQR